MLSLASAAQVRPAPSAPLATPLTSKRGPFRFGIVDCEEMRTNYFDVHSPGVRRSGRARVASRLENMR